MLIDDFQYEFINGNFEAYQGSLRDDYAAFTPFTVFQPFYYYDYELAYDELVDLVFTFHLEDGDYYMYFYDVKPDVYYRY